MFLISMAVGSSILKVISVDFIPSIMLWDHDCSQTNLVFDTRLFHFKMEIFSELSVSSRIELTFWINIYLETSRACFSISSKMGHLQLIVPPPIFFVCEALIMWGHKVAVSLHSRYLVLYIHVVNCLQFFGKS